jgi:hypothetical protein
MKTQLEAKGPFAASKRLHVTLALSYEVSISERLDLRQGCGHSCAPVAQRLEQQTHNLLVRGSNPCGGTMFSKFLNFTQNSRWRAGEN